MEEPTPQTGGNEPDPTAINTELVEEFSQKFLHYYSIYETKTLAERNYTTDIVYSITDEQWNALNYVILSLIHI